MTKTFSVRVDINAVGRSLNMGKMEHSPLMNISHGFKPLDFSVVT